MSYENPSSAFDREVFIEDYLLVHSKTPTVNHASFPQILVGCQTWRMYLAVNKPTNAKSVQASVISIPVSKEVTVSREKCATQNPPLNIYLLNG